jgi:hypothetical protein
MYVKGPKRDKGAPGTDLNELVKAEQETEELPV